MKEKIKGLKFSEKSPCQSERVQHFSQLHWWPFERAPWKLKATPYRGAITVLKVTPAIPDGAMKWLWEVKDRFFSSRKKCFHTYSSVCSAVCSVCAAVWGIRFNQVMKFWQVTFSQKRTIFNPYRTNFYL